MNLLRAACLSALVAVLPAACARPPTSTEPAGPAPPSPAPPALAPPAPVPAARCDRILWIEVRKSERRLEAACEGGGRVTWTVAVGREPRGAKRTRGDHRTPEGLYHVAGAQRPSRFRRFVAIDYPSLADAEQARAAGRLSARDFARIAHAHQAGAMPPGDTPLGGGLGFHGEGERWRGDSADLDWTDGCLAMTDAEIDFLAARTPRGTPVRILP